VRAIMLAGLLCWTGSVDLLMLGQAGLGPGTPPGWRIRAVQGQAVPDQEIRDDGFDRVLRISGAGQAAWFYRDLRNEELSDGRALRWSWRVLEAPSTSDLRTRQGDDSPIRVYVVFGNPGALFGGSGRIIFTASGTPSPMDTRDRVT